MMIARHLKNHIKQEENIMGIRSLHWLSFPHRIIVWNFFMVAYLNVYWLVGGQTICSKNWAAALYWGYSKFLCPWVFGDNFSPDSASPICPLQQIYTLVKLLYYVYSFFNHDMGHNHKILKCTVASSAWF